MGSSFSCLCFRPNPRTPIVDWRTLRKQSAPVDDNLKAPLLSQDDNNDDPMMRGRSSQSITKKTTFEQQNKSQKSIPSTTTTTTTSGVEMDSITLTPIAIDLQQNLDIKNRIWHSQTYPSCFIASDMVQKIIELGYGKTPKEAIMIGNSLLSFKMIEQVQSEHNNNTNNNIKLFANRSDMLWQFSIIDTRARHSSNRSQLLNVSSNSNSRSVSDHNSDDSSDDGDYIDEIGSMGSIISESNDISQHSSSLEETDELIKYRGIRNKLIKYLELRDEKWKLKTFKQCTNGSDIVETLLNNKREICVCANIVDAINIGQELINLKLMVHVSNSHYHPTFKKGHLEDNQDSGGGGGGDRNNNQFINEKGFFLQFINFDMNSIESKWKFDNFGMRRKLIPKMKVQDRVWLGKKHEKCFRGSKFVKVFKKENIAMTHIHALEIGNKLIRLGYIEHTTKDHSKMWDVKYMWYRFVM